MAIDAPVLNRVQFILPEGVEWASINRKDTVTLLDETRDCLEASAAHLFKKGKIPVMVIPECPPETDGDIRSLASTIATFSEVVFGDGGMWVDGNCKECNQLYLLCSLLTEEGVENYFTPFHGITPNPNVCSTEILSLVYLHV